MPKFPDKNSLRDPGSLRSGRHYVSASEVDFSMIGKATAKAGAAIAGLSGDLMEKERKDQAQQDALDLLKADVEHKRGLTDLDTELSDDTDYGSHEKKFTSRAGDVANKASERIRNPEVREKWRLRAELENEGQRGGVIKRADQQLTNQRKGELEDTLRGYTTIYSSPKSSPEERMKARKDIDTGIDLAERSGILTPMEARKARQEFNNGIEVDDAKRRLIDDPDQLLIDLQGSGQDMKAPGLKTPGTIDLNRRPIVKNADGSVSTLESMSVNIGGQEVLLPSIGADGKKLTPDEAVKEFEKTGQHLGMFDTPENATAYAKKLSTKMGKKVGGIPSAMITSQLETGREGGPLEGVAQIANDTAGSKSYGNFGLNTGGSLQQFVTEYLDPETTGIDAEPGSKAFDKQWKAYAGANPEGLHQRELAWYEDKILPQISGDLTGLGADEAMASDPRVRAYISDRMIQYGPASTRNHSQRITRAIEAAEGDPAALIKELSESDMANLKSDFRTYLSERPDNIRGLGNRVRNREKLSLGTPENDQPGGMYGTLTPLQRATLTAEAQQKVRTNAENNRAHYKQMLEDDVESIRRTGMGVDNFDLEGASRILDKSQVSTWEMNRLEAEHEYRSTHDLTDLTDEQLTERLGTLRPKPGEVHFEIKQKVFDKAEKQAKDIRDERVNDPAKSVSSDASVQEATAAAAGSPGSPSAIQDMVRARIDAQARVGVPANLQSPVTVQEARALASHVRGLSGKDLTAALVPLQGDLQNIYGPYARSVGIAVVETITRDRDLAERVQGSIDRVFKGLPPSATAMRETEILNEGQLAQKALSGYTTAARMYGVGRSPGEIEAPELADSAMNHYYGFGSPPAEAIMMLQQNPGLASQFDMKYGTGAAATALSTPIQTKEAK